MTKIEEEKKLIEMTMEYFEKQKLDFDDAKQLSRLENVIRKIISLEIEELGKDFDIEKHIIDIEFINDPSLKFKGEMEKIIPKIKNSSNQKILLNGRYKFVFNIGKLYNDLSDDDVDNRLSYCKNMFHIVFHEVQHYRQYLMIDTEVSSKETIMYARDKILKEYLEKSWYSIDPKTGNYKQYSIEKDAETFGYNRYLEITGDNDSKFLDRRDMEKARFYLSRYKADVYSADKQSYYNSKGLQEKDDVTVPILDDLICNRKEVKYLILFPILKKEYNLDGTKKTAVELIKNMKQEIHEISESKGLSNEEKQELISDAKGMYFDLIYRQIDKYDLEQFSQLKDNIGEKEYSEIFSDMKKSFKDEFEFKISQLKITLKSKQKLKKYEDDRIKKIYSGEYSRLKKYYSSRDDVLNNALNQVQERETKENTDLDL